MVRTKKWKLVWDALVEEASGLYNLAADPYEMHNYISLEGLCDCIEHCQVFS